MEIKEEKKTQYINCYSCEWLEQKKQNYVCNFKHVLMKDKPYYRGEDVELRHIKDPTTGTILCDFKLKTIKEPETTTMDKWLKC